MAMMKNLINPSATCPLAENSHSLRSSDFGPVHTEPIFWWNRISLVRFRPTVQADPVDPVPDTALFWNHVTGWFQIYLDECGFVLGFMWTPETPTMSSLPPHQLGDVRVALNIYLCFLFYLYSFCSPLMNWITIELQFKRLNLLMFAYALRLLWRTRALNIYYRVSTARWVFALSPY